VSKKFSDKEKKTSEKKLTSQVELNEIKAKAFTKNRKNWMNREEDKKLIAHELVHVVQRNKD
jgi:hypothetical protein